MARERSTVPECLPSPWSLHDHPERPLDEFALLCACVTCEAAIHTQARLHPRSPIGISTAADRIAVTLEYLSEVMAVDRTLAPLLYVADDYLRSLFVPVDWWMKTRQRWWSLTCHEDETAAGRSHPRHRVAKRQSQADAARALSELDAATASPAVPVELTTLSTAVASWRRRHRALLVELASWALAQGRPVDLAVVAMLLAAWDDPPIGPTDRTIGLWTRTGVTRLLGVDSFNWCSIGRVLHPEGVPEALWLLLGFLAASGRLEPTSDPVEELRKPLYCYGGLDTTGRRRAADDDARPRCECHVTYRGPTHGELVDLAAMAEALVPPARATQTGNRG